MTKTELATRDLAIADKGEFDLINGDFSVEEAMEIINHLIDKKINFHQLKSFSHEIRFGEPDQNSVKRSKELKESKMYANELIQLAKEQGGALRIKSSLSIEII